MKHNKVKLDPIFIHFQTFKRKNKINSEMGSNTHLDKIILEVAYGSYFSIVLGSIHQISNE